MQVGTKRKSLGWRLIGAIVAPLGLASAYLLITRWGSNRFTETSDYAALAGSVLVGAVLVAILPLRPLHRVALLLTYVPVYGVALFFYTLWFIAVVFHDGL